jgi:hypothetical protein
MFLVTVFKVVSNGTSKFLLPMSFKEQQYYDLMNGEFA